MFSDQPSPGARPIDLPPPNVIQVPRTAPEQAAPAVPTPPPYSSLLISSPQNEGTIHTNTGAFEVSVLAAPGLRTAAGDRIRVKLDGNLLAASYGSTDFQLTETDWQEVATASTEHTLQVAIVDRTGAVLVESAPINFYAHRAFRRELR